MFDVCLLHYKQNWKKNEKGLNNIFEAKALEDLQLREPKGHFPKECVLHSVSHLDYLLVTLL